MHPTASPLLVVLFLAVVLLGVLLLAYWAGRAIGTPGHRLAVAARTSLYVGLWMGATGALAAAGVLRDFSLPPRLMLLVFLAWAVTIALAVGRVGERLAFGAPLGLLIGVQAFRLPLELVMHRAADEGVMPVQMSYSGGNLDIVTGTLALALGLVAFKREIPRWMAVAFNAVGFGLLCNVLVIAVLSMPTPFRTYMNEPANTWVAYFPFVWLPVLLVQLALFGHIVILRRLLQDARSARAVGELPSGA